MRREIFGGKKVEKIRRRRRNKELKELYQANIKKNCDYAKDAVVGICIPIGKTTKASFNRSNFWKKKKGKVREEMNEDSGKTFKMDGCKEGEEVI